LNRWLGPLLHRTSKLTVIRLQIRVCAYGMGIGKDLRNLRQIF
jgi:hypothetical protein